MQILVTGGSGLIGMSVRARLVAAGHEVTGIDITNHGRHDPALLIVGLDDRPALDALITQNRIEAIIHCGAISGPMMAAGNPDLLVQVNIVGTATLLDLAWRRKVRRFVFCSSISVYGDVGEAAITEATPLRPTSVYGATKVACEQLLQGFAAEYGLEAVSLRIGRVYGPYRRANCILQTMIDDFEAGRATEIPCEPAFVYHYIHVDDVADAIVEVAGRERLSGGIYNVGSGEALTMPEIAAIAREVMPGLRVKLVPGADDVPDVQTRFDITSIGLDLGWRPARPLRKGLNDYRSARRAEPGS